MALGNLLHATKHRAARLVGVLAAGAALTMAAPGCIAEPASSDGAPEAPPAQTSAAITMDGSIRGLFGQWVGQCLTVNGDINGNGAPIVLSPCQGNSNQRWFLPGDQTIRLSATKCLSLNGNNSYDGVPLILWDCVGPSGQDNQHFTQGDDHRIIGFGNRVITTLGYTGQTGTPLVLWNWVAQDNQRWDSPLVNASIFVQCGGFGATCCLQRDPVRNRGFYSCNSPLQCTSQDGNGTCQ
jgi:hypothetical protein